MGNSGSANDSLCYEHVTNFTRSDGSLRGQIIENVCGNETGRCESYLLLPGENLWSEGLRGFLYIVGMFYVFIGIAIASDIFIMSIEVITSKKRTIAMWDEEKQERVERQVLVWNETVSNLTLMALGSSAPEILIAVVEMISNIPMSKEDAFELEKHDGLGVFTIMGSASYNLLMISAICVVAPNLPQVKKVSQFSVFLVTSAWSLWAYIWMLLVVRVISPGTVEIWEAWVTLLFFPALALTAYAQDNGWWIWKCKKKSRVSDDEPNEHHEQQNNVRVLTNHNHDHSMMHGPSKELKLIENELHQKELRRSTQNLHDIDEEVGVTYEFRHSSVRNMIGGKPVKHSTTSMGRNDTRRSIEPMLRMERLQSLSTVHPVSEEDLIGKFAFSSSSYSVLESSGSIDVEIRFGRKKGIAENALPNGVAHANGSAKNGETKPALNGTHTDSDGSVTVHYETRDGAAKAGQDYTYTSGSVTFGPNERKKKITIPIINDDMFEADSDFYVILKNASSSNNQPASLGDPSLTRITIIDDDEPGEFLFEKAQYFAQKGKAVANVIRINGSDGVVAVEYSTIDGTAKGGDNLEDRDYICQAGTLTFKHGEAAKNLIIDCNQPNSDERKNFILAIRNPSIGARIGQHSAAVINLATDELGDRLAEVLAEDDEPPTTYIGQFQAAMILSADEEGDGELKWYDFLTHFLSMPWKLVCAIIPPKSFLGAYPTFVCSILWIAGMSAIVEQLAKLLGCVINLRTAVTGCTLVALGTSVPDTFASRTVAKQDEYADAAIGNITGSNSVNVFLGLGLPWVFSSMWYTFYLGIDYKVATGNLAQAVIMFCVVGSICLVVLFIRRIKVGGELGGSKITAWLSAAFLATLWVLFLIFIVLVVYDIIIWEI